MEQRDAKENGLSDERTKVLAETLLACRSEPGLEALLFRAAQAAGELLGAQAAAAVWENEASKCTSVWPERRERLDAGFAARLEAALARLPQSGAGPSAAKPGECATLCVAHGKPGARLALYVERAGAGWLAGDASLLQELTNPLAACAKAEAALAGAMFDGATGLLTHAAFLRQLNLFINLSCRHGQPLTLLLLEGAQDAAWAEALRVSLRATDFAARHGANMWEVLLPHTGAEAAEVVIQRLRARAPEGRLAVGLATCPDNAVDGSSLFQHAWSGLSAREARETPAASGAASVWETLRFGQNDRALEAGEWHTVEGAWRMEGEEWVSEGPGDNLLIWRVPIEGSFRFICEGWNEQAGELSIFGHAFEHENFPHWAIRSTLARKAIPAPSWRGKAIPSWPRPACRSKPRSITASKWNTTMRMGA